MSRAQSPRGERAKLPERPVHQSLVRTPRYAGVDRTFLVLEVTLVVCLGYLMGVSWATAGVVLLTVGVVHPLMVRLSADDDLLPHLVVRTLTQGRRLRRTPACDGLGPQAEPSHSHVVAAIRGG